MLKVSYQIFKSIQGVLNGTPLNNSIMTKLIFKQNVEWYQIIDGDNTIDILIPNIEDISSILCIMVNGEFLPFPQWDKYEKQFQTLSL